MVSNISSEIKQSSFTSNYEKVMINVLYTYNWIRDEHAEIFKKYGILSQHYNVLRIVYGQDPKPVSPGNILEVMLDKKRDLTRLVDKLVKMNLLERQVRKDNRRMVDITITPKGKKVVNEVRQKIYDWIKRNEHLTSKEAEVLSDLLDKMRG